MRGERYLTKPKQYELVYDKGSSWANSLLVMKALPNGLALSRYGFSVGKRVGRAVIRNRVKRRLREIMRLMSLLPGWDIMFIVRPAAATAGYAELKGAVADLLSKARLLNREHEAICLKAY
ncbi:MAG: ribonuclease P protein component [Dehalococcoidia bacterium]|nr:MAG: ribonuclease P protein component [Dehalococcoidia bacterium]